MCSRVTFPRAGKSNSRSAASPASSTRGDTPAAAAIPTTARRSRRVSMRSMTNAGDGEGLAVVEGGEEELELGVLHGIRGQHVGPQGRHAPLHALAQVPHLALARAPGGKVSGEPGRHVTQEAATEELACPPIGRVAVRAG